MKYGKPQLKVMPARHEVAKILIYFSVRFVPF